MGICIFKNWQSSFKIFALLVISIILFFFSMEVSARIDDKIKYNAPFIGKYTSEILRTYDSEGIRHNVPNSRFEKWIVNQYGFRGPDVDLVKPEEIMQIICMGTSETFGLYESPGKEWPAQLKELLSEYHNLQVINSAVVGLSLKDYKPYIQKYVLKFKPDIIILFVNPLSYAVGVDIFEKRQSKPRSSPIKNQIGMLSLLKSLSSRFRVLPKIKQSIMQIVPPIVLKKYQTWNMSKQVRSIEYRRLQGRRPIDKIPNKNLAPFQNDLEELINYLKHQKIDIILSSYPVLISKENLHKFENIFFDNRRFCVELSFDGMIDASIKYNKLIETVASKYGIGFVDCYKALPKEIRYFGDNVHYTDEGAKIVASNFAKHIEKFYIEINWLNPMASSGPFSEASCGESDPNEIEK